MLLLSVVLVSLLQVSSTVEFTRIWWDKHSKHPSMTQVSLWRPVPPPGYVILGDCMVTGMYCPPSNVLVLRDTDPSELVDGRPPLLARPLSCVAVRNNISNTQDNIFLPLRMMAMNPACVGLLAFVMSSQAV